MFLYEQYEENGAYYSLTPNLEKIRNYKAKIMQEQNVSETVFCCVTNIDKKLEKRNIFDIKKLNYTKGNKFHWFNWDFSKSIEEKEKLIKNYINGQYDPRRIIIVFVNEKMHYFLLTNSEYKRSITPKGEEVECLDGIIEIPKELYLLHLIERGCYELVIRENIDELLPLFDLQVDFFCGETLKPRVVKKELDISSMILERKRKLENN